MTRSRRLATALAVAAGIGIAVVAGAAPASAHPLGNFTVNLYSGLRIGPDVLRVDHVVDLAEIPAFQAEQAIDSDGDGHVSMAESQAWQGAECARRAADLRLTAAGRALPLRIESTDLAMPPGVGGLTTLRLQCAYAADLHGARTVSFADDEDAARIGWHEVTAVGDGTTLTRSDVRTSSTSRRLTAYPKDLLTSPLDVRTAQVSFVPGGSAAAAVDPGAGSGVRAVDAATRAYVGLLGHAHVTPFFVLLALGLSVLLGGLHALAPGHGKTLMAGYLLGAGGRAREALTIATTVTITHTAGVLALGVVVAGSYAAAPERLYPVLSGAGGVLALVVGLALVRRARRGNPHEHGHPHDHGHPHPHPHAHDHGHPHPHPHPHDHGHPHPHDHGHPHPHDHGHPRPHDHGPEGAHRHRDPDVAVGTALLTRPVRADEPAAASPPPVPSRRSLISLGLAGGMVPSPSALLVLLAGIALHRTWFGIVLVVAYGLGMALTLCGAGLLVLRARRWSSRVPGLASGRAARWLPVVAGLVVAGAGLQLVVRALVTLT